MKAAQRLRKTRIFFDSAVFADICILIILKKHMGLARVAGVIKIEGGGGN